MLRSFLIALSSTVAITTAATSAGATPDVVVSIKPIHSLTAGVMKGVGEPKLLLEGATSPHEFNLKPSQAKSVQDADLVIWVGEGIETFLVKSLENIEDKSVSLELMDIKGLELHEYRDGHDHSDHAGHGHGEKVEKAEHAGHDHEGHSHDHEHNHAEKVEEAEHAGHDHDHDHNQAEKAEKAEHAGHDHEGHSHAAGSKDAHIWLDVENAKMMTREIAATLAKKDPENASTYEANAANMIERLATLDKDISKIVESSKDNRYVVFHDAYQYFEKHYGLAEPVAITLNPEVQPSAARIREIQESISEHNISCLFNEPQFSPKVLEVVAENTTATISTLDPLGSNIGKGEDHYFETMTAIANSLSGCLKIN